MEVRKIMASEVIEKIVRSISTELFEVYILEKVLQKNTITH
jgi:hypothetical protein